MARTTNRRTVQWRGFFNYYLDETEKAGIRTLVDSKKRLPLSEYISALVNLNYKITVGRNPENGCYVCAITGKVDSANVGYTYSLTHVDLTTAVLAAWFVVVEVYQEGEWPVDENQVPNW